MSTDDASKGGYGRPPSDDRLKPGGSGNPSGRPKGARSLRADFKRVLKKRVQIREGGKPRYARRQEVILLKLLAKALQGQTKAAGQLLAMWAKREFRDAPPSQSVATNNDRAIVEDFLRRNKEAARASTGTTSTEDENAVIPVTTTRRASPATTTKERTNDERWR
jgi:hypothetical protein